MPDFHWSALFIQSTLCGGGGGRTLLTRVNPLAFILCKRFHAHAALFKLMALLENYCCFSCPFLTAFTRIKLEVLFYNLCNNLYSLV